MKKILQTLVFICIGVFATHAQTLVGVSQFGGANQAGAVVRYEVQPHALTVPVSFEGENLGSNPVNTVLFEAADLKFYGMTSAGGLNGRGTIFSFDRSTSSITTLKSFMGPEGAAPFSSFIQASDGKLYGVTPEGGAGGPDGMGVIFSFDITTNTYTKLHDFDGVNGNVPQASLVQASDGKLYGSTAYGGTTNNGIIYSYDPGTSVFTKLFDFANTNTGQRPYGAMVQGNDGKLYGTTSEGGSGANDNGTIFSFDPATGTYMTLVSLTGVNGRNPLGNLLAYGGKYYGTTLFGGSNDLGTIFSFDPSTNTYQDLHDFNGTGGSWTSASLTRASDGKLYGMTRRGGVLGKNEDGTNGAGTIFSFDVASSVFTKLKDFDNLSGSNPEGGLIQASDGILYGMTRMGGADYTENLQNGSGVLFSLKYTTSTFTKLKDFSGSNGGRPSGKLLAAGNGKLYGLTNIGGSHNNGTIYSVDPTNFAITTVHDFSDSDGRYPVEHRNHLIQASDGKLYGTAPRGGANDYGTIFSFDPATNSFAKLRDMDFETGGNPNGGMVQASDGKLYGLDNSGLGFIYSFDPVNSVYTKLVGFDINNGEFPNGYLIQASNGKLYGCTSNGGAANYGVIFSYDPATNTLIDVKDFYFGDGSHPLGNLVQASDGLIYGVTEAGGSNDFGVIFSFDPATLTYTKLQDFDEKNGANPSGGLMQASDGKLYGSAGILYSYDLATAALNFDSTIGVKTIEEFIELNGCAKQATFYKDSDTDGFGDPGKKLTACTQPEGYVTDSTDCDDNNPDVKAGAKYYRDADGDGYGDPNDGTLACTRPEGYVSDNTDCDDTDKRSHGPVTYYRDADGDRLGDAEVSIAVCGAPPHGYVRNNFDCDDRHCSYGLWNLELKMCHNGQTECVPFIYVFKKLHHGWKLGPCVDCNTNKSSSINRLAPREISKQALRSQFSLSNYPNPFKGSSTIRYQLPVDSKVSIKVYDALGRALTSLVDEYKKAGNYSVTFNANRFGAGALYYRIIARSATEHFEQTNKMILVR